MGKRRFSGVSKRASPRATRSRSKMSAAGTSGSASGGALERMVEEAADGVERCGSMEVEVQGLSEESDGGVTLRDVEVGTANAYEGKGKGRMAALPAEDVQQEVVWDGPFRLFDLPTEIRLEIYRACLTRPNKILLSKPIEPKPKVEEPELPEDDSDAEEVEIDTEEIQRMQAAGMSTDGTWYEEAPGSTSLRAVRLSSRRRGGMRAPTRSTLRTSSSARSRSQASAAATQPRATNITPRTSVFSTSRATTGQSHTAPTKSDKYLRNPDTPPLIVALLRTSKTVYKEARDVLYSENHFSLDIFTAVHSLAALHQRSRRRIKHVELEIPTYTEILEAFSETVRLSLRYCSGLRRLVVHTPFTLPGGDAAAAAAAGGAGGNGGGGAAAAAAGGNVTVYANGFDILRWLPQTCEVVLEGVRNKEIDAVVGRHMRLAGVQDQVGWQQRMHIPPEGVAAKKDAEEARAVEELAARLVAGM